MVVVAFRKSLLRFVLYEGGKLKQEITMNKMGVEPIPKVMLGMGIPMILSMVLQACYNIVDSMFVARIPDSEGIVHAGEYAVNALTLAFPIQMLIVAFGIGTGVGVNALLSKTLGERNEEKVAKIAGNGVFLGIVIYIAFLLFGLVGIHPYLSTQTSDETVLSMGSMYLSICTVMSVGMILFSIYEKLLQSTGKTIFFYNSTSGRRNHKYRVRPDFNLRLLWASSAWNCRCGVCNSNWTDGIDGSCHGISL